MRFNSLKYILGPVQSADPSLVNLKTSLSKSSKLLSEAGFVRFLDGEPILMTPLTRSLSKLRSLVHDEMVQVNAHEITLPMLFRESLMERANHNENELFRLKDRAGKKLVLSPTHEEAITYVLSTDMMINYSHFPFRFYQIGTKFRDEIHPKHGLLRSKEFLMKDLYCFDDCPESRNATYNEVLKSYHSFFQKLKIPYECVESTGGDIMCIKSHEFHFLSNIGADTIMQCNNCGHKANMEKTEEHKCKYCKSSNISLKNGIEVAHTFNIGPYYSEKFKATYRNKNKELKFIEMSCFGIGMTRILAAAVEVLSTDDEIRWPSCLSPYKICIIPPKMGSKEEEAGIKQLQFIYKDLHKNFKGDVVVDDRNSLTIGKRLYFVRKYGFPYVIVIGKNILDSVPKIELYDLNQEEKHLLSPLEVTNVILGRMNEVETVQLQHNAMEQH